MDRYQLPLPRFSRHHLSMNWNFNRWFLFLGWRLRLAVWSHRAGDYESLTGPVVSSRVYRTVAGALLKQGPINIGVIVVAEHGRFGNSIRNVAQALAVAKTIGVAEVVAKSIPQLPSGSWTVDRGLILTHDHMLRPRRVRAPAAVLAGDFFVAGRLPVAVQNFDYSRIGKSLANILSLPDQPLPDDTLVIHIRSGDAFQSEPHPELAQPPLSFYLEAVSQTKPARVIMVFESDLNPVIRGLKGWLRQHNIPCDLQSSSFSEDLAVLLRARSLVLARGTLGPALTLLSSNLKTVTVFGSQDVNRFMKKSAPRVLRVVDKVGDYESVVVKDWRNTRAQRDFMLSYPQDHLGVKWEEKPSEDGRED